MENYKRNDLTRGIIIAALASAVWQIWKERNRRIFKNEHANEIQVCKLINLQVHDLLQFRSKAGTNLSDKTKDILDNRNINLSNSLTIPTNPLPDLIHKTNTSSRGLMNVAAEDTGDAEREESTSYREDRWIAEARRRRFEPP